MIGKDLISFIFKVRFIIEVLSSMLKLVRLIALKVILEELACLRKQRFIIKLQSFEFAYQYYYFPLYK